MSEATPESDIKLPSRTTPTWEMELLVSGVTVFALLQLPGWMDQSYLALRPRLDLDWEMLGRFLFAYSKMGALLLAAAFVVHLALRGYWIALVGMDSIYPDGVDWDRLRMGPLQRRFIRKHAVSGGDRIERADNRASIVFALGVSMATVMAGLVAAISLSLGLTWLVSTLTGWHWLFPEGTFWLVAAVGLPYVLTYLIDRRLGDRLSTDGFAARSITAVFAFYRRIGFGRDGNPTIKLLQSHVGERKTTLATMSVLMLCALFAVGQLAAQQNSFRLGEYALWPEPEVGAEDSLVGSHYRDQEHAGNPLLPTIDSMFPAGGYLSLIVPFNPKRHPALLTHACGNNWRAADGPARRSALLACLGKLQDLRMDGAALAPASLRYYADPKSGQDATIAIIPIAGLTTGEHVLTLRRPPSADPSDHGVEADRYRIAFWR